jgi:AraC-like DNA-binding protein
MLSNQELSITEVSEKLGFGDIYSFSKIFKKHTGFSPRYYKNYIASDKKPQEKTAQE